jgi:LysM domain-containing protein
MRRSLTKSLLAALLLGGCSTSTQAPSEPSQQVVAPAPEPTPMPTFFVYVVKFRGETLGRIAEWYTGSYDNWRKIARVNGDLSVPNTRLKIGREVKIPNEIVVRQDPLPEPKPKRTTPKKARGEAKPSAEVQAPAAPQEAPEPAEAPALPSVIGPR